MSMERQKLEMERQINEITDGIAELKENRGISFPLAIRKDKEII